MSSSSPLRSSTPTPFQQSWLDIARRLELCVRLDFGVTVGETHVVVPVLLEDFGGPRGMLLVTDFDTIAHVADALVELGFGFSCLSEPRADRAEDEEIDSVIEMLCDWGWGGAGAPPSWWRER